MSASRLKGVAGSKGRYSTKCMPAPVVYRSALTGLTRIHEGKVRDIYAVDDDALLIVTTDRLSAFDVVLPDPIPDKGRVLNGISNFWFARTRHLLPNHLTGREPAEVVRDEGERALPAGRAGGERARVWHRSACGTSAGRAVAAAAIHAGDQGAARRARREHKFRGSGRAHRSAAGRRGTRRRACAVRVRGRTRVPPRH